MEQTFRTGEAVDSSRSSPPPVAGHFTHRAVVYEGRQQYVERLAPFLRQGVEAGDDVLVVVGAAEAVALRAALGDHASGVHFEDMLDVGANPSRIIPLWQDFVDSARRAGRVPRGVGEPIYHGRSPEELSECIQHEALLNVAFDAGPAWELVCPYDATLGAALLGAAHATHPVVAHPTAAHAPYTSPADPCAPLAGPELPAPPADAVELAFAAPGDLRHVRRFVADAAAALGVDASRREALVLAASEAATNSVGHGPGGGVVRVWRGPRSVVVEVADAGSGLADPLAGRRRPSPDSTGGRGLWMANALCDLVQLRASAAGTVVRLHTRVPGG